MTTQLSQCKSLNDIASMLGLTRNKTGREKAKKYLTSNGLDWTNWKFIPKKKTIQCIQCGKETTNAKFCSTECKASYNRDKKSHKTCPICNSLVTNRHSTYCSNKCHSQYLYLQYINRWKQGLETGLHGYNVSSRIRKYLFDKFNNKCQICGWGEQNPHTELIPLEVHHIDGNYLNNSESNLQLLCPNCHALTETYKALNKQGRKQRAKYT